MRTEPPGDLVAAYRATHCVCGHCANAFVLRIGVPSPPLASLCRAAGASTAAFLTACNPGSEPQPAEVNAQAHARLGAELTAAGNHLVPGAGEDPTDAWTAEPSYLVLGMALDAAQEDLTMARPSNRFGLTTCGLSRRAALWMSGYPVQTHVSQAGLTLSLKFSLTV